jgi:uncharacterized protein (TIGR02145 family)
MKTSKRLIVLASVSLALLFTFFGCSSDGGKYDDDSSSSAEASVSSSSSIGGGSSSSGESSSSSITQSSSGSQQNAYETVKIGNQTWLKRNLNAMHKSGNSWCYNNQESNCEIYGRLYDWAAAMDLPSECNETVCAELVKNPHQGLCPDGFHIPTNEDWDELLMFVDEDTDGNGYVLDTYYDSFTAAYYLKATSSWTGSPILDQISVNGIDKYGFSAVASGTCGYVPDNKLLFQSVGTITEFRTSNEKDYESAYARRFANRADEVIWGTPYKKLGEAVRCVKDN